MTSERFSLPLVSVEVADLLILESVESTNDFLMSIAAGCLDFTAVVTTNQTSGRGRLGRSWITEPGNGIAFSFMTPSASANILTWVPLLVGATLTRHLQLLGVSNARLKWPNDVVIGDVKVAGILCEVGPLQRVVVGVGLNVLWSGKPYPQAISLSEVVHNPYDVADILLAATVNDVRNFFERSDNKNQGSTRELVVSVLGTLGRPVTVTELDGSRWSGVAREINNEGHLLVQESTSGELRSVMAADIQHLRQ